MDQVWTANFVHVRSIRNSKQPIII